MRYLAILFLLCLSFVSLEAKESGGIINVTQNNYSQEVEQYPGKAIVVVSTSWCGACKRLKPVFEILSNKFAGQVKFVAIDADQSRDLVDKLKVTALPTIFFMNNGKVVLRKEGALELGEFEKTLQANLKS